MASATFSLTEVQASNVVYTLCLNVNILGFLGDAEVLQGATRSFRGPCLQMFFKALRRTGVKRHRPDAHFGVVGCGTPKSPEHEEILSQSAFHFEGVAGP